MVRLLAVLLLSETGGKKSETGSAPASHCV